MISKLGSFDPDTETQDDLKRISGVGPKMEDKLHQLGIFTFEQVRKMQTLPNRPTSLDSNYFEFILNIDNEMTHLEESKKRSTDFISIKDILKSKNWMRIVKRACRNQST